MPVAFILGIASAKFPIAAVGMLLYYALLISGLWQLRKLPGAGFFYGLALLVTVAHALVAQLFLIREWWQISILPQTHLIEILFMGILVVFVLNCWAASKLAFQLSRGTEGMLHFFLPGLVLLGSQMPFLAMGLFFLQGFRGATLAKKALSPEEAPSDTGIGFNPIEGS